VHADASQSPPGGPERAVVLVVEPHLDERSLLRRLVVRAGHVPIVASSCRSASGLVARPPGVDLALVDSRAAYGTGECATLLGRLRELRVPCLALGALGTDTERREALAAGFSDYLAKPLDVETFAAWLERQLARSDD
jgi:DNA-binding response OmpR family regulator